MGNQINIGIIGVGRFGTNYLKTINELDNASVKGICSTKESTLNKAIAKVSLKSEANKTTDYRDILEDKKVDAVVIATPGSTHYNIAKQSLLSGKHVLVEKPFCINSKDAEDLVDISLEKKKILAVGHLHLFNPGILRLKEDIKSGLFGNINYINILHCGNGPIRSDINALWDFFPHSLSILMYLLEKDPMEISVNGASYIKKGVEDVVTMDLKFPENIFATSFGSWLYPLKKMDIGIVGEKLYATFDDYVKTDKIRYYDSRPKIVHGKPIIDDKRYKSPNIGNTMPLTGQLKHFLDCIENNKTPINDGKHALRITKILELAQESLNKGSRVKVSG